MSDNEQNLIRFYQGVCAYTDRKTCFGHQLKAHNDKIGKPVSVRLAGEDKTYLGVYVGEIAYEIFGEYKIAEEEATLHGKYNPAIFVPDLGRIVFGFESWWGIIEDPDQLREITDEDIENVWYVQAIKALANKESEDRDDGRE